MKYDPFTRGKFPVGVTTIDLRIDGQNVPVEIWYPANAKHQGEDFSDGTMDVYMVADGLPPRSQNAVRDAEQNDGVFPIVIQPHAAIGHRRDAATTCTHLASHGYIVASPEFVGDTAADLLHDAGYPDGKVRSVPMTENLDNRERTALATIEAFAARDVKEFADRIDTSKMGAVGVSLGGWTTLRMLSLDQRVKSALVAVPSWGTTGPFEATKEQHARVRLDDWGRDVPVFLVAAENDGFITPEVMTEMYKKLPSPKRFAILSRASHFHWFEGGEAIYDSVRPLWESGNLGGVDAAALRQNLKPFAELCPAEHGLVCLRTLSLAHMDATLKNMNAAQEFIGSDLRAEFAQRGIDRVAYGNEVAMTNVG